MSSMGQRSGRAWMRARAGLPMLLLLAGCTMTAPVPEPAPSAPGRTAALTLAALAGTYDADPAACASASEMRMTIAADHVQFYEARCTLVSQAPQGGGVQALFRCASEGDMRAASYRLTPAANGVTVSGDGVQTTRVRCQ